ncbi:MAG: RHS repeat-associated core domain-containing protein [Acutalibacteraceae bacterium]
MRNVQGDVIGIYDSTGTVVVEYTYDAWGKPNSVTGSLASTIGVINPLRYRGYYYDDETGFYYLQSRYYDPEVGRFINADDTDVLTSTMDDVTDKNLFAYCDNNPVMRIDEGGYRWSWSKTFATIGIVAGVVALGALVVVSCGTAAPAAALVGGGILSGFSATTVATASTVAYWSGVVAVNSTAASAGIYLAEHTKRNGSKKKTNDKHTKPRPGRETEKKKQNPKWKPR